MELTTQFTDAHRNGFFTGHGRKNLSNSYQPTASYDLPPNASATTPSEAYMGHNSLDVQCATSGTTRYCQYRKASGTWFNTTTRCSTITGSRGGVSETDRRNNFCRGTHGTRIDGDSGTYNQPVGVPAYYYVYYADAGVTRPTACSSTVANRLTDNDCYLIRYVHETAASVDADGDGDMDITDQQLNFANWYSFARTRNLATQTAASLAFADLDDDARVAWQALNTCRGSSTSLVTTDCDGWSGLNVSNRIRPFSGQHKSNFYNWVSLLPTNDSTPLPAAMKRVGEYYRSGLDNGPYDTNLEATGSVEELSCRRNYHVLMTDGIWNDAISVTGGNVDNQTLTLPESSGDGATAITQYTPRSPYKDNHTSTLADLSMYYWINDLRTTLANDVLANNRDNTSTDPLVNYWNPRNDPATWQHMVNFTIGLGLTGYLAEESLTWDGNMYGGNATPDIAAATVNWPQPASNDPANVADLWHAAINSRGQFFSADDPASLAIAFQAALTAITDSSGSSAALSANSTSIQPGNTFVYQAKFDARDWSGTLLSLRVGDNGRVETTPVWDASVQMPAHGARRIFTINGATGTEFNACANLSTDQRLALNTNAGGVDDGRCTDRLNWLRGNPALEVRNGGTLRNRPRTIMGDVINSDPGYVKNIDYGYSALSSAVPGATSYASFLLANASRTAMVYVGANDGHMHGFRASTGVEQFSYIPAGVYGNLSYLTDPSYAHRNYVDGAITGR